MFGCVSVLHYLNSRKHKLTQTANSDSVHYLTTEAQSGGFFFCVCLFDIAMQRQNIFNICHLVFHFFSVAFICINVRGAKEYEENKEDKNV